MYCHFLVDIPTDTGKISFNKRADTTYVEYTYERVYDKKRRYNVPRRTTIGKLSESDSEVVPFFEQKNSKS